MITPDQETAKFRNSLRLVTGAFLSAAVMMLGLAATIIRATIG